jgi:hypothetical protein
MLSGAGNPTELYAQFQTESGRPAAALQALKNAFAEIFRRNQYAHKAEEGDLVDVIVAVTGLPRNEPIVRSILNTFQVFQEYAKRVREGDVPSQTPELPPNGASAQLVAPSTPPSNSVGLVYNINIVLPESTNVEVYNTIFKSVKSNLLT